MGYCEAKTNKQETKIKISWENTFPLHQAELHSLTSDATSILHCSLLSWRLHSVLLVKQRAVGAGGCHAAYTAVSPCSFFFLLTPFLCFNMSPHRTLGDCFLWHGIFSSSSDFKRSLCTFPLIWLPTAYVSTKFCPLKQTFPLRCHQLHWWAQPCSAVCPLWSHPCLSQDNPWPFPMETAPEAFHHAQNLDTCIK